MLRLRSLVGVAAAFLAAGALTAQKAPSTRQSGRAQANHALDRANLDTTCAACDDFYTFSNGGWLKTAKIPPSYPSFGSFEALYDRNEAILHGILDTVSRDLRAPADLQPQKGTNAFRVAAYYDACMDTTRIETLG